jgi:hypothetical protein
MAYNYYFGNNTSEVGRPSQFDDYEEHMSNTGNIDGINSMNNMNNVNNLNNVNPEYLNVNVNNYNYNYINTTDNIREFGTHGDFIPKRFVNKKPINQYKKKPDNVQYNMMKQPQVMARYFVIKSVDEDNIHKVRVLRLTD